MFSSVLGILCGLFIGADHFGYHALNGVPYFLCWVVVVLDAIKQDIGVKLKNDE